MKRNEEKWKDMKVGIEKEWEDKIILVKKRQQ